MKSINYRINICDFSSFYTYHLMSCSKNDEALPTEPVPIDLTQDQVALIESGNAFAFDIFNQVLKSAGENENVMISPLSISYALSMTVNGANGDYT